MKETKTICERLSTNLKSLMKQAGIKSQAELAVKTGISQTQISSILRLKKAPSIKTSEKLAVGTGCEPWVLLAPTLYVKEFHDSELQLMMYCYLRLLSDDQEALARMAQQLYEANRKSYLY